MDQYGHRLSVSIADEHGYGPCRSCLKQFVAGERRILFSYSPNPVDHPYDETGPVYIHAEGCGPYPQAKDFPPEVENGRVKSPLVFRAYSKIGVMIDAVLPDDEPASKTVESLFEKDEVAFVHVRNRRFGCFIAQVDRACSSEAGLPCTSIEITRGEE